MGCAVRIVDTALRVVPGTEVATEVRIRNTGHLVDRAEVGVVGEAAAWARAEPAQLNLLPGQEDTVLIVFAPPRTHEVTAGPRPFAVRALSREDPAGSAAEEGVLTVAEFDLVVAEMVPRTSRAPRAGRHQLAVDNLSNHQLTLRVTPTDPDSLLEFRLDAREFVARPGTATFLRVRARPTTRFLRGPERQIPFDVAVAVPGSPPVVAPGTVAQQAILPAWILRLVLIVALLAALWVGVLQPRLHAKVRDAAGAEAVKATAPLAPRVNELAEQDAADKAAEAAASASPTPTASATPTATATPGGTKKPSAKPAPVPVPVPPSAPPPGPEPEPAPTPTPVPARTLNFYKGGWVKSGETKALGPGMPAREETVVRVTKIIIHSPYTDYGRVFVTGIRAGEQETALTVSQQRTEIDVDQPAYFDRSSLVQVRASCIEPSGFNPGPEGLQTEERYCLFYVLFRGFTEDPPPKPWPSQSPGPSPTPQPELSTFSRRAAD